MPNPRSRSRCRLNSFPGLLDRASACQSPARIASASPRNSSFVHAFSQHLRADLEALDGRFPRRPGSTPLSHFKPDLQAPSTRSPAQVPLLNFRVLFLWRYEIILFGVLEVSR